MLGYLLILASWLIRTYGAVQEARDFLRKPLIWQSPTASFVLVIIWALLLISGVVLLFDKSKFVEIIVALAIYFVVAPSLLAPLIKTVMDKLGI